MSSGEESHSGYHSNFEKFFSDVAEMERVVSQQEVQRDWDNDVSDPMENLMLTKERPGSTRGGKGQNRDQSSGKKPKRRGRGGWDGSRGAGWKRGGGRGWYNGGRFGGRDWNGGGWYNDRDSHRPNSECSSFYSGSSMVRPPPLLWDSIHNFQRSGNDNQLNFYDSHMDRSDASSMDGVTSVSRQGTSVTPVELSKRLAECADYEASLLTLIDRFGFNHKNVRSVVAANPKVFELEGEVVRLRPQIGVCQSHLDQDGCPNAKVCKDLHICSQYLMGKCRDKNCLSGHYMHTDHNKPILRSFYLNMNAKLLFNLFKCFILPSAQRNELRVCDSYNNGDCEDQKCGELHLCLDFIAKCCARGANCTLNHSITNKETQSLLQLHGISVNESPRDILFSISVCPLIKEMVDVIKGSSAPANKEDSSRDTNPSAESASGISAQKVNDSDKAPASKENSSPLNPLPDAPSQEKKLPLPVPAKTCWSHEFKGEVKLAEICYNSVEGFCPYEEVGCWRLHSNFHFYWQVRTTSNVEAKKRFWVNLTKEQVLALEKAYCDPQVDVIDVPLLEPSDLPIQSKGLLIILSGRSKWVAHFKTMQLKLVGQGNVLDLRRLCTEETQNKIPEPCVFAWYFCDKNAKWIEYGNADSTGEEKLKCDVDSAKIERHLKQNPTTLLQFQNQSFQYTLDLTAMKQTNLETNVSRNVRRRPKAHLKEEKEKSSLSNCPDTWDDMQPHERVRRVTLAPSSNEYQTLSTFIAKQGALNILKIERVQNPFHWAAFQNKVKEMTSLYKDQKIVNIQQLFHGTKPDVVPLICEQNFDWRLHGTNVGQAYGRGTYFSPLPATSHGYTTADASGNRFMFVAKVAVGTITAGNSGMTRPPNNPQFNVPFDTTVDNSSNPSIIVKYDKQEYYPEYILTIT